MSRFVRRSSKLTQKQAMDLARDTQTFGNFLRLAGQFKRYMEVVHYRTIDQQRERFLRLGKPNATLPELESNPGVWIFDDTQSPAVILVFSDCHRKNAFKGTAVEVANYHGVSMPELIRDFLDDFERMSA
jgi:hypothetical protein